MKPEPRTRGSRASRVKPHPTIQALGAELRSRRMVRNWSQDYIAEKTGVTQAHISNVERGERGSLEILVRFAEALGMRLVVRLEEAP